MAFFGYLWKDSMSFLILPSPYSRVKGELTPQASVTLGPSKTSGKLTIRTRIWVPIAWNWQRLHTAYVIYRVDEVSEAWKVAIF